MIRFTIRQQINAVGNGFVMHFRAIIEIWGRGEKKKEKERKISSLLKMSGKKNYIIKR